MPEIILPSTMVGLLVAFEPCSRPELSDVQPVGVAGWIHCWAADDHGRGGGVGRLERCHISVFHRFFTRAQWSLMRWGRWCSAWRCSGSRRPAALHPGRRHAGAQDGQGISLATMHHDPLLSSARKPFCSFGHSGSCGLWVPLADGGRAGRVATAVRLRRVQARGTKDAPGRPRKGRASRRLSKRTPLIRARPSCARP